MIQIVDDFDLRPYNTFGISSRCSQWIAYTEQHDLPKLIDDLNNAGTRYFSIGAGSNLVFATPRFDGAILSSSILTFEVEYVGSDTVRVTVGSGLVMDRLCEWAAANGLWGIENLSMIPGKVGASAVQNVGAYGCEVADVIDYVDAYDTVDRRFIRIGRNELDYGYRSSLMKQTDHRGRFIVTEVSYLLSSVPKPRLDYGNLSSHFADMGKVTPQAIREVVMDVRRNKLPNPCLVGSAGSFFKNPVISMSEWESVYRRACQVLGPAVEMPYFQVGGESIKLSAAWLIDKAGCKTMTCGGAGVWPKQPLVLVNATGSATGNDVVGLKDMITAAVSDIFGITLDPEAEIIR